VRLPASLSSNSLRPDLPCAWASVGGRGSAEKGRGFVSDVELVFFGFFARGRGFLVFAAAFAAPLAAQNPAMTPAPLAEWPGAEIASGVAFQGDGSVTLQAGEGGLPVLAFWRPVLFNEDTDRPVAGRMDCLVAASEAPFADDAFDPEARHDAVADRRREQGFYDRKRLRDYGESVRRLDVVGRRHNPSRPYVLTYMLVRDGERMIDIRRNCTFVHGDGVGNPDVLPYVERYTRLIFDFGPEGAPG